eukprot:Gb_39382 [translate_table: standard]
MMCALRPGAPPTWRFYTSTITATLPSYSALPSKSICPNKILRDTNPRPHKLGINVLRTTSSLKETQKQTLHKVSSVPPRLHSEKLHPPVETSDEELNTGTEKVGHQHDQEVDPASEHAAIATENANQNATVDESVKNEDGAIGGDTALKGIVLAGLLLVGVVGGFGSVGYIYKDQINAFLTQFSDFIDGYGPAGYALFVAVYAGLEIFAIPAIPLTMSAGLLFGNVTGTIIVSISGTIAATVAFLIARYFARERILKLVEGNKKFVAIDKAIGENGFRVVTLLRLSPLLPFSLGNYLYGLTSVKLAPYVLGSWLGMLPGTWAYVSAGAFGRAFIQEEVEGSVHGGNEQLLTLGLGLLATALAATYVTRLAKDAVKDLE